MPVKSITKLCSIDEKVFGIPNENVKGSEFIINANKLDCFLSYKELLRTYLFDNKETINFKADFAKLLVERILIKKQNKLTGNLYSEEWEELFT